ncbi:MAG: hypothetical protein OXC11_14410 [Rhodospirillales bacterium]|nr:hypothetical protein [Rhodospirillales bacterium]
MNAKEFWAGKVGSLNTLPADEILKADAEYLRDHWLKTYGRQERELSSRWGPGRRMAVSIWRVTAEVPEPPASQKPSWRGGASEGLVMATSARAAARLHLRFRHDMDSRLSKQADEFRKRKCATVVPVHAVRLCEDVARSQQVRTHVDQPRGVFVASEAEAADKARATFGNRGHFEPCDPAEALRVLGQEDLFILARCVWTEGAVLYKSQSWHRGPLFDWTPYVWQHLAKVYTGNAGGTEMRISSRLSIVYALRLAMLEPKFGTDRKMYALSRRNDAPASGLERFHELHDGNIRPEVIERMYRLFGPRIGFTDEQLFVARALCEAYGIEPGELSISEFAALWEDGLKGLAAASGNHRERRDMVDRAFCRPAP